jgi:hypothetical protein
VHQHVAGSTKKLESGRQREWRGQFQATAVMRWRICDHLKATNHGRKGQPRACSGQGGDPMADLRELVADVRDD